MKRFFMILGIVFVCLILAAVIGFFILNSAGTKMDEETKSYVDKAVPVIVGSWDMKELTARASPELLKAVPVGQLEKMFNMFSAKLGGLKDYKGSAGQSGVNITNKGKVITARYVASADFEKAPAIVKITLIRINDEWRIMGFYIESQALMPAADLP